MDVAAMDNIVDDSESFFEWVRDKHGNVYGLFEIYLCGRFGHTDVTVSFDWMAFLPKHESSEGCGWRSYQRLPKWFKQWVQKNATGPYRTAFQPLPSKEQNAWDLANNPKLAKYPATFFDSP